MEKKWIIFHYIPLDVIIALACGEVGFCPLFLSVPKQPLFYVGTEQRCTKAESAWQPQAAWVSRGQTLFPTPCLVEDRAEMQNGHLMA